MFDFLRSKNIEVEEENNQIEETKPEIVYSYTKFQNMEILKNDRLLGLIVEMTYEDEYMNKYIKNVFVPPSMSITRLDEKDLEFILSLLKELNKPF